MAHIYMCVDTAEAKLVSVGFAQARPNKRTHSIRKSIQEPSIVLYNKQVSLNWSEVPLHTDFH